MIEWIGNAFTWYVGCMIENMLLTIALTIGAAVLLGLLIRKLQHK